MNRNEHSKIGAHHLKRNAYLYVRQSTVRQVFENTESTKRQYALRQHAVALGWPGEQVVVIDDDLGTSGASGVERGGFQRLVAEVGLGCAGVVMGLEVSRLARNSSDWHRLLEICALTNTLILDEDGIYDPASFNDRLLLGLKGTMSEAELHVLRARLQGGLLNKARRGELKVRLPVGFVYTETDQVIFDPDEQVQETLRLFFQTLRRTGTAGATVGAFQQQGVLFPQRPRGGIHHGELVWLPLTYSRALDILHNPRFAGAYVFGRTRQRKRPDGSRSTNELPQEQWTVLIHDAHAGYISWSEYEENQCRMRANRARFLGNQGTTPPRSGPALLQGLVLCGVCGRRMTVGYHHRKAVRVPHYVCQRTPVKWATPRCQSILGTGIDQAVSELLLEIVKPLALEVAIGVQDELQSRLDEVDKLRRKHVERAEYEAELARRRYMRVDPDNRLVADSIEADWNNKLRALAEVHEEYERRREADHKQLDEEQRVRLRALATDFPRLWSSANTSDRDRKRMLRLLIEDVTLVKGDTLQVHLRFRGGKTQSLTLPRPQCSWELRQTDRALVDELDLLLDEHTNDQAAAILNERGRRSGTGLPIDRAVVKHIIKAYGLKTRPQRLADRGMVSAVELARHIGVRPPTIHRWRRQNLLIGHLSSDKEQYMYDPSAPYPTSRRRSSNPQCALEGAGGVV
jgi:DNA invertase Pin-like site-specific DNA recombinase